MSFFKLHLKHSLFRGASVAQSVKHLTLDFGLGPDLMGPGMRSGLLAQRGVCLRISLSPSAPLPTCMLARCLSQVNNKS